MWWFFIISRLQTLDLTYLSVGQSFVQPRDETNFRSHDTKSHTWYDYGLFSLPSQFNGVNLKDDTGQITERRENQYPHRLYYSNYWDSSDVLVSFLSSFMIKTLMWLVESPLPSQYFLTIDRRSSQIAQKRWEEFLRRFGRRIPSTLIKELLYCVKLDTPSLSCIIILLC